jgi:hypothetical protein
MESEEPTGQDRLVSIDCCRECTSRHLAHIENENAVVLTESIKSRMVGGLHTINLREVPLSSCITARNTLG